MRASVVCLLVLLCGGPAGAQDDPPLDLPVSLERIREALASSRPRSLLEAIDVVPHFRLEVEQQRPTFVEMFSPEAFKGGPVPPGGLYAFEQRQRLSLNSTPYVASVDLMSIFSGIANVVSEARRARAAAAARAEVERAMAEFCAAQPDGGAGVVGCR